MKNNVLKTPVSIKKWGKAAGIRALKTFAQTMASLITTGAAISEVDWKYVISVAAVSAFYSILTSIIRTPEEAKEGE